MKIEYRLATLDDAEQLVQLRVLMQFEVNHPVEKTVPAGFALVVVHP
jgi:hypothetical protein